jgi:hypothetical protein
MNPKLPKTEEKLRDHNKVHHDKISEISDKEKY